MCIKRFILSTSFFKHYLALRPKGGGGGSARPFGGHSDHTRESYDLSLGMPKRGRGEVQPNLSAARAMRSFGQIIHTPGCRRRGEGACGAGASAPCFMISAKRP